MNQTLGIFFSMNVIKHTMLSHKKTHLKMSSVQCRPYCPGLGVLRYILRNYIRQLYIYENGHAGRRLLCRAALANSEIRFPERPLGNPGEEESSVLSMVVLCYAVLWCRSLLTISIRAIHWHWINYMISESTMCLLPDT